MWGKSKEGGIVWNPILAWKRAQLKCHCNSSLSQDVMKERTTSHQVLISYAYFHLVLFILCPKEIYILQSRLSVRNSQLQILMCLYFQSSTKLYIFFLLSYGLMHWFLQRKGSSLQNPCNRLSLQCHIWSILAERDCTIPRSQTQLTIGQQWIVYLYSESEDTWQLLPSYPGQIYWV